MHRTLEILGILLLLLLVIINYSKYLKGANLSSNPYPSLSVTSNPSASCHIHGVLPDPSCTPGATDPFVTQSNVDQTICVRGYTKTVRPSLSYTSPLKREQIKEYGYSDTNTKDYEEDHLIPLELGGAPSDPKNLWPEPGASPNAKDDVERRCNQMVCSHQILLQQAQQEIASNWQTACR